MTQQREITRPIENHDCEETLSHKQQKQMIYWQRDSEWKSYCRKTKCIVHIIPHLSFPFFSFVFPYFLHPFFSFFLISLIFSHFSLSVILSCFYLFTFFHLSFSTSNVIFFLSFHISFTSSLSFLSFFPYFFCFFCLFFFKPVVLGTWVKS